MMMTIHTLSGMCLPRTLERQQGCRLLDGCTSDSFQMSLGDHCEKMITLKNQRTLCEHMATTYAVLEEMFQEMLRTY